MLQKFAARFFMLYRFTYLLMQIALRFFYRNVYLHGLQNIPEKGPVVLIANHASSVMDALLLGVLLKRPVHFFARGDMFKHPATVWLMKKIHMMPVHHHQEGRQTINRNNESFTYAKQLLEQGEMILFFPEGISHTEYQLFSFKKGVFRIAFEWLADHEWQKSLPCVPIGLTYDAVKEAHQNVTVHIGNPFLLNQFQQLYVQQIPAALLQCSKTAYQHLQPLLLHFPSLNRMEVATEIVHIKMNSWPEHKTDWICNQPHRFDALKKITDHINQMNDTEWETVEKQYHTYQATMNAVNCTDKEVSNSLHFQPGFFNYLLFFVGFPFFVCSWLISSLPLKAARFIADKKVYRMDFYTWIWMTTAIVFYIAWLLLMLTVFAVFSLPVSFLVLLIMLIAGIWITIYSKHFKMMVKWLKWKKLNPAKQKQLLFEREKLITMVC